MSSLVKNAKDTYDQLIKILLIGNSGVGKTQILLRYSENNFKTSYMSTIGIDFKIKKLQIDHKTIKLQIWDTAGQERYQTITQTYYKGAMGIILVFALNDSDSLRDIDKWMNQIKQHANENIVKILIGNKSDLDDRSITRDEAEKMAEKYSMPYFETSAKDGTNIKETFSQIAKLILEFQEKNPNQSNVNSTKLSINQSSEQQKSEEASCC